MDLRKKKITIGMVNKSRPNGVCCFVNEGNPKQSSTEDNLPHRAATHSNRIPSAVYLWSEKNCVLMSSNTNNVLIEIICKNLFLLIAVLFSKQNDTTFLCPRT